jgi:hypothetical protein
MNGQHSIERYLFDVQTAAARWILLLDFPAWIFLLLDFPAAGFSPIIPYYHSMLLEDQQ